MEKAQRALRDVGAAVQAGKVPPDKMETYVGMYLADPEGTAAYLAALSPVPEAFVDLPDLPDDDDGHRFYEALYATRNRAA